MPSDRYTLPAARIIDAYLTIAALADVFGDDDMRAVIAYLHAQSPDSHAHARLIDAIVEYIGDRG